MLSLVVLTVIFVIGIVLISLIFKRVEKRLLLPLAFVFISMILFFSSFVVGGFEGMGLTAVSVALFVASAAALIITVLIYKIGPKNDH
jgi:hypothetical protein